MAIRRYVPVATLLVALLAALAAASPAAAAKKTQTIKFESTPPSPANVGGNYVVKASATSGLPVGLSVPTSTVCTLSGTTVTFVAEGTCTIDANQPGNIEWEAAPQVHQEITVERRSQTIKFESTPPSPANVGGNYAVKVSASSGLPVSLIEATPSVCTISGTTVTFKAEGTCTVEAKQEGNTEYVPAKQEAQSFTVERKPQTVKFESTPPSPALVGEKTYVVKASASSGLPVSLVEATPLVCTISGTTVSFVGAGTCTVEAKQEGSAEYAPAKTESQSFAVTKRSQTVKFTSALPLSAAVGGEYTPTGEATPSGLPVSFSTEGAACELVGSAVKYRHPGTCTVAVKQAGNFEYAAATQVVQTFPVGKGQQTITFTSSAPTSATVNGSQYTVTASAPSELAVSFVSGAPTVCTISGSTVSFVGPGTCTIDANQGGSADWEPAPQAQQSFAVHQLPQTVAFTSSPPNPAQVGGTYTVSAASSVAGFEVSFSVPTTSVCTISGSTVTFISAGICTIDAEQPGNAEYAPAPQVQQSFIVIAPPAPPGPPAPGPIVQVKPVVVPDSSFKVLGASLSLANYSITFVESVMNPGTFGWVLTFENGRFGVFAAAKSCKAGSIRLKGKCRPARVLFARGSETVVTAGSVTFTVKPTRAGVQALRKAFKAHRGLPVTAIVTFQSARGGQPAVRVQSLIVKGRK